MALLNCFVTLALIPSLTSAPQPIRGVSEPCIEIVQNGFVYPNPQYPYVGHGYYFDIKPDDNDMPWLRQFSADKGIFANVNMSLEWKDREFEMMKAIVSYTAHHMTFTGISEFTEANRRARTMLEVNEANPGIEWGCGDVAYTAVGLAQAQGIPARSVNGRDEAEPYSGDYWLEMYSTRYNRWIYLDPKCYNWIEHETDGPLGQRELLAYELQSAITSFWNGVCAEAERHPPLVFMPTNWQMAPIPPYGSVGWNMGRWKHFGYTAQTLPNRADPPGLSTQYLCNDAWDSPNACVPSVPIVAIDDLNANYPLNNVEASVISVATGFQIRLKNNMFGFTHYESKSDVGPWTPMVVSGCETGVTAFVWQPVPTPSTITIRGVNEAGVHSPDVVVLLRDRFLPGDLDANGVTDSRDIQPFVSLLVSGQQPVGDLACSADFFMDGTVDARDVRYFIEMLAGLSCPYPPPPGPPPPPDGGDG